MDINQIQAALEAELAGADNWTEEDWAEFEDECGEDDPVDLYFGDDTHHQEYYN